MKERDTSVSVIVPAYNEAKRIATVLQTLCASSVPNEIICVNDGSTDMTLQEIKKVQGITLINLKKNHGKAFAISTGVKNAKGAIVLFIDADLNGLNDMVFRQMTEPLLEGNYDAVVGYPFFSDIDKFFKPITGVRAYYRADLLPHVDTFKKKGYGLELYLNFLYRERRVKILPLKGVRNSLKYEKQSYDTASRLMVVEVFDILFEILTQKNPLSYFVQSYFSSFYLKKNKNPNTMQANQMAMHLKRNFINKFKTK